MRRRHRDFFIRGEAEGCGISSLVFSVYVLRVKYSSARIHPAFSIRSFNSCFITLPLSMALAMHSMSIPYIQVRMLGPIYAIRLFL